MLIIAPPVGPLGSGLCGGVDTTLFHLAAQFKEHGHSLSVIAPKGSNLQGVPLIEVEGAYQPMMQLALPDAEITLPNNAVLANMLEKVCDSQNEYDIILNFAYDWLPLYLTGFYQRPVVHWLTLCSCSRAIDAAIYKTTLKFPGHVAAFTKTQANTYQILPEESLRIIGSGIALDGEQFCLEGEDYIAWIGRISPEKGVEDALNAANRINQSLKVMGCIQDRPYWEDVCNQFPKARMEYLGFLSTKELYKKLRRAKALLVTSKCAEAFGNVAIEALACGVPVIAYRQGGLNEIVKDSETGYLVDAGDIDGLIQALQQVNRIDRRRCRQQAEEKFSVNIIYQQVIAWFQDVITKWRI